jgi:hypothetical protein
MAFIRGLTYPLQVANGQLVLSEDNDLIAQHIYSVLETRPYERVMRADYGLQDRTFETMDPTAINAKITAAINDAVTGIQNLRVSGSWQKGDSGQYKVRITYDVNGVPQPPLSLSLVI